jgi:hypothetical protein
MNTKCEPSAFTASLDLSGFDFELILDDATLPERGWFI